MTASCMACSREDGDSFRGTRVSVGPDRVCSNCFYSFRLYVTRDKRSQIFKPFEGSLLEVDWNNPEATVMWDQWLEQRGKKQ